MPEQVKKTPCCMGLLAHVDAGKTTLSEALLFESGVRRTLGRVDHRDAYLDTHELERARGITIFSKQALLETPNLQITLMDTPGHGDFAAETERVMPVLDCAVLVISGTDGIQAHTLTLWHLLERYRVPVFLFVNKMDLPGKEKGELLRQLQRELHPGCLDFGAERAEIDEAAALCDEALLENYLETGTVTDANLRGLIGSRKLFPCSFGSALKLQGVGELLALVDRFAPRPGYGAEFGAQVYKISRDPQGARLTWLKVTGGSLKVRTLLSYVNQKGEALEEKVIQLRRYSGEKFTAVEEAAAGTVCAVTGLSGTCIGQSLGAQAPMPAPLTEPVMSYRLNLPPGADPAQVMPRLKLLEEEDPQLRILWEPRLQQIQVQIMGKIQLQVLRSLILQRFGLEVRLDQGRIHYKETVANSVEGVGHFEPLRHYAEVHLLLEPLPRGSGLVFDTVCSTDVLDLNWQRLILTHLAEKTHVGVLTGSPITDMKLTLLIGRAHLKHTEGGDFRQATYLAVRQGLMQAKSVVLEPWYRFTLTVPTEAVGRAITDIRAMGGEFDAPEAAGNLSTLAGTVPAAELGDYADQMAAYTQGRGRLQIALEGYAPCHNQEEVVAEAGYDPEADLENTPDSVFCGHGAGFTVKWDQVPSYMHLESPLKQEKPAVITGNLSMSDRELEAIMEREFGPIRRPQYRVTTTPAEEQITIRPPKEQCIIVDAYNVIFAWEDLAKTAAADLDAARRGLLDDLSSFAAYRKLRVIVVFDGYRQKGNPGEKSRFSGLQVVYTKEGQTCDAYIEALIAQIGRNYSVRVATSDSLIQVASLRSGVLRMSARELGEEVEAAKKEMRRHY